MLLGRKKSTNGALHSSGSSNSLMGPPMDPVIGRSLEESPRFPGLEIPTIIEKSIRYIEANHMKTEGIFRIAGGQGVQNRLRERFDRREDVDLSNVTDGHAVASLLKLYLRELPEALFPFDWYESFVGLTLSGITDPLMLSRYLRTLINYFPRVHYCVTRRLFMFLHKVSLQKEVNLMGSANLATVFAPNILRRRNESPLQLVENTRWSSQLVDSLIELAPAVFERGEAAPLALAKVVRSKHPYAARTVQELTFKENELFFVTNADDEDGWIEAELRGQSGLIPSNYVDVVLDLERHDLHDDQTVFSAQLKSEADELQRQIENDASQRLQLETNIADLLVAFESLQKRLQLIERHNASLTDRLAAVRESKPTPPPSSSAPPRSPRAPPLLTATAPAAIGALPRSPSASSVSAASSLAPIGLVNAAAPLPINAVGPPVITATDTLMRQNLSRSPSKSAIAAEDAAGKAAAKMVGGSVRIANIEELDAMLAALESDFSQFK